LGKDGATAIGRALTGKNCLVQHLYLKSVSMNNQEIKILAKSLECYPYIHTLDVSDNRLTGKEAGIALASIIRRQTDEPEFGGGQ